MAKKSAELQLILSARDEATKKLEGVKGAVAGLSKVALGIGVGAVAAVGALGAGALKLAKDAAEIPGVAGAFEGLGGSIETMRKGALGMVTDIDLMKSFNSAAQLVSQDFAEKLPDAMGYLSKISAATGEDMGYLVDSLVKGVGRLSGPIIDNLKIQVSLEEAASRAAEMFGVEAESLTKAQQQAGMMSVVMEKLAANTASMPEVMGSAAQQTASFEAGLANLKNGIGVALLPILNTLVGVLGGFLQEHGPQLIAWAQQAAGWITTTLVPGIGQLVETLKPFVQTIATFVSEHAEEFKAALIAIGVILAGAAILTPIIGFVTAISGIVAAASAAGGVMAGLGVVIAALGGPITLIIAAVALLAAAWAGNWGGIRTTMTEIWDNKLKPAFETMSTWLSTNIPIAIATLTTFWTNTLLPAITAIWQFLETYIVPIFKAVAEVYLAALGVAIALVKVEINFLIAVFTTIWQFLQDKLGPILETIKIALTTANDEGVTPLGKATEVVTGIMGAFKTGLDAVKGALEWVAGKLAAFKTALDGLSLPGWLTPGSPTPFELGLRGIGGALADTVTGFMRLASTMDRTDAKTFKNIAKGLEAMAGAFATLSGAGIGDANIGAMRGQIDMFEQTMVYAVDRLSHLQNVFGYDTIKKLQNTAKRFKVILETVLVDLSGIQELALPNLDVWFAQLEDILVRSVAMIDKIGALVGGKLEGTAAMANAIAGVFRGVGSAFTAAADLAAMEAIDSTAIGARLAELQAGVGVASTGMQLAGAAAGGGGGTISFELHLVLDIPGLGVTAETDISVDAASGEAAAQNMTILATSKSV